MIKSEINSCRECYDIIENSIIDNSIYDEMCSFNNLIPDYIREEIMNE